MTPASLPYIPSAGPGLPGRRCPDVSPAHFFTSLNSTKVNLFMQRLRYTLAMADIAVIAGSASDGEIVSKATSVLEEEGITYDFQVLSAHRNPEELSAYVKNSEARVFITVAGLSAALPGVVASLTEKPVIGVPVAAGTLGGIDALLAIAQMPRGVPVACVGIGNGGANAAHLAVRILKA